MSDENLRTLRATAMQPLGAEVEIDLRRPLGEAQQKKLRCRSTASMSWRTRHTPRSSMPSMRIADCRPISQRGCNPRWPNVAMYLQKEGETPPHDVSPGTALHRDAVIPHPETGEPILYIAPGATNRIVGLPQVESRALLDAAMAYLYDKTRCCAIFGAPAIC